MSNDQDNDIDWERLDRFVRGLGSRDERNAVEIWAGEAPSHRELIDAMRNVGRSASGTPTRFDAHQALRRFQREIAAPPPERRLPRVAAWHRPSGWRTLGTLIATGAAAGLLFMALDSEARAHGESQRVVEPPPRLIATVAGQRAAVELSDGSHVRLSAGSRLTVSGAYGAASGRRDVTLIGEASFSVQHDSARPFVVHTPYGVAEDLGTEFVVNTYPEMHGMRLAVRDGRVGIRAGASDDTTTSHDLKDGAPAFALLDKGDVATVTANGGLSVSRGQDVSTEFSGADGALVLRAVSLRDAIPILERWYGIRIHINEDAVLSRHVSGTFHDGSAVAAIETIAMAVQRRIHWKGNTVTFMSHTDSGEPQ